jgi:ABC-type nitrate/sulfonate/bicarbonate transport system substrate-binding protein
MIQVFAVIVLMLATCPAGRAETSVVRFGQIPSTVRGMSSLDRFVAEKKAFFAKENLSVQFVQIAGGTGNVVKALDRSEVDLTQTATPYLIQAVLVGSNAVAIAGETANPIYSLIAKPEISTFADLKGKTVGLSLPVDTISVSTRRLLALKGLNDADYRVKQLVGTPDRFKCLQEGDCDAVPLGQPDDLIAIKEGYRRLGLSTDAVAAFQFEVVAARRSWAQTNKHKVVDFVRALAAAYRYIRDPSNRDEIARYIVELTGSSEDTARETLKLYFKPDRGVVPKEAEISLPGFRQVIAFMLETHAIPPPPPDPQRFVDLQYLEAARSK